MTDHEWKSTPEDISTYEKYKEKLDRQWESACRARNETVTFTDDPEDTCWVPGTAVRGASGGNVEINRHGYYRVRFLMDKDPQHDTPRTFQRRRRDGTAYSATRKDRKKGGIYLTHLTLLATGELLVQHRAHRIDGSFQNVRYSVSHLCGNRACFRPTHLVCEPHVVNLSRIPCAKEYCAHKYACLKSMQHTRAKTLEVEAEYLDSD
jgi:hypothetical protein